MGIITRRRSQEVSQVKLRHSFKGVSGECGNNSGTFTGSLSSDNSGWVQIKSLLWNKGRTSISFPRLNHPITAVGITLRPLPITTTSANHKHQILLRCLDSCRVRRRALTCTCAGAAAGRRPWPWPGWSASRNSAGRSCSTVWWPVWWRSTGTPSPEDTNNQTSSITREAGCWFPARLQHNKCCVVNKLSDD